MNIKEGQVVTYRGISYKRIQGAWAESVHTSFTVGEDIDEMIDILGAWRDSAHEYSIELKDYRYGESDRYELVGWSTTVVSDNTASRINEKIDKTRQRKLVKNRKAKEEKNRQERATYERLKKKFDDEEVKE